MTTRLSPDTPLRWSEHLEIRPGDDGTIRVYGQREPVRCSAEVLALLAQFGRGASLSQVQEKVSATMAHDWARTVHTVLALLDAGALMAEGVRAGPDTGLDRRGFGGAPEHIAMLDDRVRTCGYLGAVANTVRPGDVVLDLGTGTGVLAVAAARAGASRVYAIECSEIADAAQRLFAASGLGERITLLRGDSSRIELPERADVIVSELVGNEPLSERALEYLRDARRRLAVERPRMVPVGLKVLARGFRLPDPLFERFRFTVGNTARWQSWYGQGFNALAAVGTASDLPVDLSADRLSGAIAVTAPATLAAIDFQALDATVIDVQASLEVTEDGPINAVGVHFELALDDANRVDNDPLNPGRASSWRSRFWLPNQPVSRTRGQSLGFRYRHSPLGSTAKVLEDRTP